MSISNLAMPPFNEHLLVYDGDQQRRIRGVQIPRGAELSHGHTRIADGRRAIEHVVVLMLENRSFDSMLGTAVSQRSGLQGIHPERIQTITRERVSVFGTTAA